MNDIAKMRKEFEEKIRLAELENKYNEKLEKEGICIRIFSKDKNGRILASVQKTDDEWRNPFNEHDAQNLLRLLPITDDYLVHVGHNKKELLPCDMCTYRSPKKSTVLEVKYIHKDLEVWFELPINERNNELMQYFMKTQRELDNNEIGLYYGCLSPRQKSNVQMLPFLTFNCGSVVRFQGGRHKQISAGHISCILQSIENDDFAWERTAE